MRLKTALVAVLALALQAQGAPVSSSEAASAVRGWAASGEHLGINFRDRLDLSSGAVETSAVHTASSGATFYAVRLRGCGTVFVSGDTEIEPVIAFTESPVDYSKRSGSPFWVLLDGDISTRGSADGAAEKWSRYWAADPERPRLLKGATRRIAEPSDLRVAPLVKSMWGQEAGIYNYYTPNNYPCGCVATMTAQIMRYYHGPTDDSALGGGLGIPFPLETVEKKSVKCKVGGKEKTLTMQGGTYAWDNMPLTADGIDEEQTQNIGKLTSDIGIAVAMSYAAEGSGASLYDAVEQLVDTFGYKQAFHMMIKNEYGEYAAIGYASPWDDAMLHAIFANLDAKRPCMLGISNTTQESGTQDGHAVVADGYGFEGEGDDRVPYVHLNMGWDGYENMWYNLPDMKNSEVDFNVIDDVGYNIFPDIGEKLSANGSSVTHAIMSGRILAWEPGSGDPVPVEGARVNVYKTGGSEPVTNVYTDAKGVWAAIIPQGTYDVEAAGTDGKSFGSTNDVSIAQPRYSHWGNNYFAGNSWGNDIVLGDPIVVAGNDTVGYEPFGTIDRAVSGARKLYSPDTKKPVFVKVVAEGAFLRADSTIDFNCVLFATNAVPAEWAVERRYGAKLTVKNEGSLVMSNIVFAAEKSADTLVDVMAGASLSMAGVVDFGVGYKNAAVRTADANGFRLLGAIDRFCGFTLDCASATNDQWDVAGYCVASDADEFEALRECAPHIANFRDTAREVRASLFNLDEGDDAPGGFNFKLVWVRQPVPFEDAAAYYVDSDGVTNTAGRIDVMLDGYVGALANGDISGACVIGIRKDDTMSRPVTVGEDLTVIGEGVEVSAGPEAEFTVAGGVFSVSGVSFTDHVGNALFHVNGDDAELSLSNVAFSGVEGTNRWSGAVAVEKGSASIEGATFSGCMATGLYDRKLKKNVATKGGAVYVAAGCSLRVSGCTITGCSSRTANSGGGIYVDNEAELRISGEVSVSGNTSGEGKTTKADDIHLANLDGRGARLVIESAVTGSAGVFWEKSGNNGYGNADGCVFADAESEDAAVGSTGVFFCGSAGQDVVVEAFEDSGWKLRWAEAPAGPQPLPYDSGSGEIPDDALACVAGSDGSETNFYASVEDAITAAKDGETVFVIQHMAQSEDDDVSIVIGSDMTVSGKEILLAPYYGDCVTVWRAEDCSIAVEDGGALTVTNVEFRQSSDLTSSKPMFNVCGGTLVLDGGSGIFGISGDGVRNAGAVSVWKGGRFAMKSGAMIGECRNSYNSPSDGCGRGAGVLVDDGSAVLEGGLIYNCVAYTGGGVFVGNKGSIEISGDVRITGNKTLDGRTKSNLVVYDNGRLVLAGPLSDDAVIGYTEGASADDRVFASVSDDVSDEDAAASAGRFRHDVTGDIGMAVGKDGARLLVWSAALGDDGKFAENPDDGDGDAYELLPGGSVEIAVPQPVADLVYDGKAKVGVASSAGYSIAGNIATNAGGYTATATLRPGYVWTGGETGVREILWNIGKATYDIGGAAFADRIFRYDGRWHTIEIEGDLPDGVSVSYEDNRRREEGTNEFATAHIIAGDPCNYETVDGVNVTNMTAKLIIEAVPAPVWPAGLSLGAYRGQNASAAGQTMQTTEPAADDGWVISAVAAEDGQWFSLYETDSLSDGFNIENMEPVERRQAVVEDGVPVIRFTRTRTSSESLYWRIVAEP